MKKMFLLVLLLLSTSSFADLHTVPGRIELNVTLKPGETAKYIEQLKPVLSSNIPGAPVPTIWTEAWLCLLPPNASINGTDVEVAPGVIVTQGGTPINYLNDKLYLQGSLSNGGPDKIGDFHYYFNYLVSFPNNTCSPVVNFNNPVHMHHNLSGRLVVKNVGTTIAKVRAVMWFLGK